MSLAVTLEPRLQAVAAFVPKAANLGDIGTDHAYLPIALYEAGQIAGAVAVDVHEGPYQSALASVKRHNLTAAIEVRLGDGLTPLKPGEVNALTMAGMGGRTMLDILAARPDVLEYVNDLILQPQNGERNLRLTLLEQGWRLKAEKLVAEGERVYVVLAWARDCGWDKEGLQTFANGWLGCLAPLRDEERIREAQFASIIQKLVWHFGPLILAEPTELLTRRIIEYAGRLERQRKQMQKSNKIEISAKLKALDEELAVVEGLQRWR